MGDNIAFESHDQHVGEAKMKRLESNVFVLCNAVAVEVIVCVCVESYRHIRNQWVATINPPGHRKCQILPTPFVAAYVEISFLSYRVRCVCTILKGYAGSPYDLLFEWGTYTIGNRAQNQRFFCPPYGHNDSSDKIPFYYRPHME